MKERPILMSAPMVRATLREVNPKTVTRRLAKPQPKHRLIEGLAHVTIGMNPADDGRNWYDADCVNPGRLVRCPYGGPGDRLWCRESWQYADWTEDGYPMIRYRADGAERWIDPIPEEATDSTQDEWAKLSDPKNFSIDNKAADRRWRSSIHMPRWASRITLEIVSVRAERVQDITEEDAIAEGWEKQPERSQNHEVHYDAARDWYADLWDSINGAGSWARNEWVWRIEYRRIKP